MGDSSRRTQEPTVEDQTSAAVGIRGVHSDLFRGNSTTFSMISVRTDWSSQDEFSPQLSMAHTAAKELHAGSGADPSESWHSDGPVMTCRSTRRSATLTSAVSPRSQKDKPVRYGVHSIQNRRNEMEDAHLAVLGNERWSSSSKGDASEATLGSLSYFAIFDGHGGSKAAEYSGEHMYRLLAENRDELLVAPEEALRRAFARTEDDWLELARTEELMDGTTAAVALVDRVACRCIVGNVGDSEVLLGAQTDCGQREFKTLTQVHHLKRSPAEAERVTAAGGRVWRGRLGHPKISPQVLSLSVSRAIGDIFFKDVQYTDGLPSGLIAEPYIASVDVCRPDIKEQFLLIGCDGLWDTVSYKEASDLVFEALARGEEPQTISEALVRLASDAGSSDNITVLVVVF